LAIPPLSGVYQRYGSRAPLARPTVSVPHVTWTWALAERTADRRLTIPCTNSKALGHRGGPAPSGTFVRARSAEFFWHIQLKHGDEQAVGVAPDGAALATLVKHWLEPSLNGANDGLVVEIVKNHQFCLFKCSPIQWIFRQPVVMPAPAYAGGLGRLRDKGYCAKRGQESGLPSQASPSRQLLLQIVPQSHSCTCSPLYTVCFCEVRLFSSGALLGVPFCGQRRTLAILLRAHAAPSVRDVQTSRKRRRFRPTSCPNLSAVPRVRPASCWRLLSR
jgi:hypothetical protein